MAVKVDKELMNQLAAAHDGTVEAVVKLKPAGTQIVSPPERTEKLTKRVLDRTSKKSGHTPERYNVFRNLGSFCCRFVCEDDTAFFLTGVISALPGC